MEIVSMNQQRRGPVLTKAELRAQAEQAMATIGKPVVKLPTKLTRQCGKCGEPTSVMVAPGEAAPAFKCKRCEA
jgi:hypothetical protein